MVSTHSRSRAKYRLITRKLKRKKNTQIYQLLMKSQEEKTNWKRIYTSIYNTPVIFWYNQKHHHLPVVLLTPPKRSIVVSSTIVSDSSIVVSSAILLIRIQVVLGFGNSYTDTYSTVSADTSKKLKNSKPMHPIPVTYHSIRRFPIHWYRDRNHCLKLCSQPSLCVEKNV